MNNLNKLLTFIGFKITWISCIFGEIYISSWFGFFVGIVFLLSFFLYTEKKLQSFKIILIFSFLGYSFDSLLSLSELYNFNSKNNFLFLPIWLMVLWPSFCTLFIECFSFLKKKYFFSILLGGIFGPISYYAGLSLNLVNVSNYSVFIIMAFFWSTMMFVYSKYF